MREECIGYITTILILIVAVPGSFIVPIVIMRFVSGRWATHRQKRRSACPPQIRS